MSELILQDHVRPIGPVPTSGIWSLLRVVAKCFTLAFRFLGAFLVGKGNLSYADKLLAIFWRRVFQWGNAKLVVENREAFDGRTAIVMSNHTSLLDVPTLLGSVPGSVRMVFKESLSKVPIWGWALVAAGFVPIDRGNRKKAIGQLENAKRVFAKGVNVWVSPEGTRSRGRGLLPFKKGGFHLAKQLGAPIIPAFIAGTEQMISPTSLKVVQDGVVHVRFGQPIETDGKDVETLMNETREAIVALGLTPP
jgi:1-acyl-sn-glycerol-3-phosphate acyltransferase